jgi:DNA-binding Lrp family transcriptional regulator
MAQERALASLSLIDGMVQIVRARTMLAAVYFVDSETQAERRLRQLQGVDGASWVGPEMVFEFPQCSRRMSRSDWRLMLALRRNPEASVAELAEEVGQSTRTTSRRFDSLLDEGALIFDPIFEFSRFYQTLAVLVVSIEPRERCEEITRQILALHPEAIPTWGPASPDPNGKSTLAYLWVTAPTTAGLDELTARVARIPGVSDATLWYPQSTLPVRSCLDERIETVLRLSDPAG